MTMTIQLVSSRSLLFRKVEYPLTQDIGSDIDSHVVDQYLVLVLDRRSCTASILTLSVATHGYSSMLTYSI